MITMNGMYQHVEAGAFVVEMIKKTHKFQARCEFEENLIQLNRLL